MKVRLACMTLMLLDIGMGELLVIVVIAAVFLGPEKVPALAKKAGRILKFLRSVANTATDQIKAELGPEVTDSLKELDPRNLAQQIIPSDLLGMQSEMTSLKAELEAMRSSMTSLHSEVKDGMATSVNLPTVLGEPSPPTLLGATQDITDVASSPNT